MPKQKVRITQVARVERSILVDVEADSLEEAIEKQAEDAAPNADNPAWTVVRDEIMNEKVEAA